MPPERTDNPARRNRRPNTTTLPAEGRKGPLPKWPLSKMQAGELALWRDLWTRPQAVVWENQRLERIVARYCRLLVAAEEPGAMVTLAVECRQLEDRLLLNPERLKRAFYEIAEDEVAKERAARQTTKPKRPAKAADPRKLLAV